MWLRGKKDLSNMLLEHWIKWEYVLIEFVVQSLNVIKTKVRNIVKVFIIDYVPGSLCFKMAFFVKLW